MDRLCTSAAASIFFSSLVRRCETFVQLKAVAFLLRLHLIRVDSLILFVGCPLESLTSCVDFSRTITNDPTLAADVIPRFYLNASLALV